MSSTFSFSMPWFPNGSFQDLLHDAEAGAVDPVRNLDNSNTETSWLQSPSASPSSSRAPSPLPPRTDTTMVPPVAGAVQNNRRSLLPTPTRTGASLPDVDTGITAGMPLEPRLVPLPLKPRQFVGYKDLKSVSARGDDEQKRGKKKPQSWAKEKILVRKVPRSGLQENITPSNLASQSIGTGDASVPESTRKPSLGNVKPAHPESTPILLLSGPRGEAAMPAAPSYQRAQVQAAPLQAESVERHDEQKQEGRYMEESAPSIAPKGKARVNSMPNPRLPLPTTYKFRKTSIPESLIPVLSRELAESRPLTPFWPEEKWHEEDDDLTGDGSIGKSTTLRPKIYKPDGDESLLQPEIQELPRDPQKNITMVETAESLSYWLGRLTTLMDAYHYEESFHEPDPAVRYKTSKHGSSLARLLQSHNSEECRTKRAFRALKTHCQTPEAKASLEEFREKYAKRFGRWSSPWFGDELGLARPARNTIVTHGVESNSVKMDSEDLAKEKRNTIGGWASEFGLVNMIRSVRRSLG